MDKIERRKNIIDFAKKLNDLAKIAPDGYARKDLYRALNLLRNRYSIPPEKKQNIILAKISHGISTFTELLTVTGFTKPQISRGFNECFQKSLIVKKKYAELE